MRPPLERLVVLGSTITALALVRNAHALKLECVLVDTTGGVAARSRHADARILESTDSSRALERVLALGGERPSALIADSDRWLQFVMRNREALGQAFATLLHPDNEALQSCLDKTRFLTWCLEQRLPAPRLLQRDELRSHDFDASPLMVRPQLTLHGQNVPLPKAAEVRGRAALDALLEKYDALGITPCISESLIRPGIRQFSVGVARDSSGESRVFVAEKIRPNAERCGGGTYVVARPDSRVAHLAEHALEAMHFFGIGEMEIFLDEPRNELFFVEINARPWVQYELARRSGFDLLGFLLEAREQGSRSAVLRNARWLHFWDDFYVCFSRSSGMLRSADLTLTDYLRSLAGANVSAVWSWSDPGPSWSMALEKLRSLAGRPLGE